MGKAEIVLPWPGETFAGYTIERVLGRGGMGSVYLAEHENLRRKVAVKVLRPEYSLDEGFRGRFVRESQLLASLDHPNIVRIYDAAEVDGILFLAMQYVEGGDLREALRACEKLTAQEAHSVVAQVGAALDAAHAAGLVHRDVKPGNILLGGQGRVYLSDFGVAKRTESAAELTHAGGLLGSVEYLSPEQIEGRPLDGRSDVYALGCVAFECLTGELPFSRESEIATLQAHLNDPVPAVTLDRDDLDEAVDTVFATALAKTPDERYRTGDDLGEALRVALGLRRRGVRVLPPRRLRRRAGAVAFAVERGEEPTTRVPLLELPVPERTPAERGLDGDGAQEARGAGTGGAAPDPTLLAAQTGWVGAVDGPHLLLKHLHPDARPVHGSVEEARLLDNVEQAWLTPHGLVLQAGATVQVLPVGREGWSVDGIDGRATVARACVFYVAGGSLWGRRIAGGPPAPFARPMEARLPRGTVQCVAGEGGLVLTILGRPGIAVELIPWDTIEDALAPAGSGYATERVPGAGPALG